MRGLSQSSKNRQQYIPQGVKQAMDKHMQSTMPASLQRQMGDGAHMSSRARQDIASHMEKTMPSHMRQYAGAYMEQNVANPGVTVAPGGGNYRAPAPVPQQRRLDHSNVSASQYDAKFNAGLFEPDSQTPPPTPATPPPPEQSPQPQPPSNPGQPDYGFIMEPPQSGGSGPGVPNFLTNGSPLIKVAFGFGALLVLIIIFAVGKSLFSGGGNTQALTDVVQQQQTMIHVLTNGPGQNDQQLAALSPGNQIFSATAQASLTSAQQQMVHYMQINHKKVDIKKLEQSIDPSIDQQLTAAANNSTYDSTFKQVMQSQLTKYERAIQAAYKQTSGPNGRKLLTEEFKGAQLLMTQLQ